MIESWFKIDGKLSLRTSVTGMINLDDVKVPKENILNIEGMRGPFSCLNNARLGISFGVLGSSQFCFETALEYSQNRKLFGQLLSEKEYKNDKQDGLWKEYYETGQLPPDGQAVFLSNFTAK